jgi:hypothetical protein
MRWTFSDAAPGVVAPGWQFQPQFLCYPGRNSPVGSRLLARVVRIAHRVRGCLETRVEALLRAFSVRSRRAPAPPLLLAFLNTLQSSFCWTVRPVSGQSFHEQVQEKAFLRGFQPQQRAAGSLPTPWRGTAAPLDSLGGNQVQDSVKFAVLLNRQERQDRKGESELSSGI